MVSRAGGRARVCTKHLLRVEPLAGNAGKRPQPRLRPRKSSVPVYRPNQKTGSAHPAGPGTSAGSGTGQNTVEPPLSIMERLLGARPDVQSTRRTRGVLPRARARSLPHTGGLRLPCAPSGLSPMAVQLGARLSRPAPSTYAEHSAFFGSKASCRRSMQDTARPSLWAMMASALPFPCLLTSRAW